MLAKSLFESDLLKSAGSVPTVVLHAFSRLAERHARVAASNGDQHDFHLDHNSGGGISLSSISHSKGDVDHVRIHSLNIGGGKMAHHYWSQHGGKGETISHKIHDMNDPDQLVSHLNTVHSE
jgi:hypothetical protein